MEYQILYRPSYSLLQVKMQPGDEITAESGAMVSMSSTIEMETKAKGGLKGIFKRSVLGGESIFMNTFRANDQGEVTFAPPLPGDISAVEINNQTVFVQRGSYIASSPNIEIDTKWAGAKKGLLGGEGVFFLKISGTGLLFLSSFGAIHEIELGPGQEYVVDNGHIVAMMDGVEWDVKRVGGLKSTLFSGEGLVSYLRGPGKVLIQSRSTDSFLSWLIPLLPVNNR